MERTKYKADTATMLIGVIFSFIGILCGIIGVSTFISWNEFKKTGVEVPATITDVETHRSRSRGRNRTTHIVYVEYDYAGQEYHSTLGYYVSGMRKGGTVKIYVDPNDPSRMRSESMVTFVVLGGFALVFGGVGVGFLVYDAVRRRKVNLLIDNDMYVICDNWEERRGNTTVNGVRYHCITAYYNNGYKDLEFKSRDFHPNKSPVMPGQSVRVFVDTESDPTTYYVDI